jgi:hypothetical protein
MGFDGGSRLLELVPRGILVYQFDRIRDFGMALIIITQTECLTECLKVYCVVISKRSGNKGTKNQWMNGRCVARRSHGNNDVLRPKSCNDLALYIYLVNPFYAFQSTYSCLSFDI